MPGTFRAKVDVSLAMLGKFPDLLRSDRGVNVDEGASYTFELPDSTTDQSLIVIGVAGGIETVTCLAIMADQVISLKLGAAGSNVAFTLTANVPVVLPGISLSAVSVSNSSGSTANVQCFLAGT